MVVEPLRIIHPTDFSPNSLRAFHHALKLALATRGEIFLLHLGAQKHEAPDWSDFPHVRETLQAWGLLEQNAPRDDVLTKLGIQVHKFDGTDQNVTRGIETFTNRYGGDLVVLGTAGRQGLSRRIAGSTAQSIMQKAHLPTLFVSERGDGFVDGATGQVRLNSIIAPVDHDPKPEPAIRALMRFVGPLGIARHGVSLVHVGDDPPVIYPDSGKTAAPVECLGGPVTQSILAAAADADLIAMVTAGHSGLLDALRGSTTEQIVRQAPCPVLAIPAH